MISFVNFRDRYNIILNNDPLLQEANHYLYIKIIDTLLFSVYEENFTYLILHEHLNCKNLEQLYLLIISAFENNNELEIIQSKNKLTLSLKSLFTLNLVEQQNQLDFLKIQKDKFEQKLLTLENKMNELQNQTLSQSIVMIGKIRSVPFYVPINIYQLIINRQNGDDDYNFSIISSTNTNISKKYKIIVKFNQVNII